MNEERATKILVDTMDALTYALAWDMVKERNPDRILPSSEMLKAHQILLTALSKHAADKAASWNT